MAESVSEIFDRIPKLFVTASFNRSAKKLNALQKAALDLAAQQIVQDVECGQARAGDLKGVRTFQLKSINQLNVLVYRVMDGGDVKLLALGDMRSPDLKPAG